MDRGEVPDRTQWYGDDGSMQRSLDGTRVNLTDQLFDKRAAEAEAAAMEEKQNRDLLFHGKDPSKKKKPRRSSKGKGKRRPSMKKADYAFNRDRGIITKSALVVNTYKGADELDKALNRAEVNWDEPRHAARRESVAVVRSRDAVLELPKIGGMLPPVGGTGRRLSAQEQWKERANRVAAAEKVNSERAQWGKDHKREVRRASKDVMKWHATATKAELEADQLEVQDYATRMKTRGSKDLGQPGRRPSRDLGQPPPHVVDESDFAEMEKKHMRASERPAQAGDMDQMKELFMQSRLSAARKGSMASVVEGDEEEEDEAERKESQGNEDEGAKADSKPGGISEREGIDATQAPATANEWTSESKTDDKATIEADLDADDKHSETEGRSPNEPEIVSDEEELGSDGLPVSDSEESVSEVDSDLDVDAEDDPMLIPPSFLRTEHVEQLDHEQVKRVLLHLSALKRRLRLQLRIAGADELALIRPLSRGNDVVCKAFWDDEEVYRTKLAGQTLAPRWAHDVVELSLPLHLSTVELKLELWDVGNPKHEEFLGEILLNGPELLDLPMCSAKRVALKRKRGSRSARAMQYVKGHLLLGLERLRRLDIAILGADNLAGAGDTLDDVNDVYCVLHLLGREIGRTSVQKDTLNPVWNNAIFSAVLPPAANGTSATASGNSAVHVEVFDMDAGGDECIGVVDVPLELLMIDAREPVELELQQGPQVRRQLSGTLTMAWRGVRPPRNPRADGEELRSLANHYSPRRRVGMQIEAAKGLSVTGLGGMDRTVPTAYTRVFFNGTPVGHTAVASASDSPVWSLEYIQVTLPVDIENAKLRFEVWDHDASKDDFLGQAIVEGIDILGLPAGGPGSDDIAPHRLLQLSRKPSTEMTVASQRHIRADGSETLRVTRQPLLRVPVQLLGGTGIVSAGAAGKGRVPNTFCKLHWNNRLVHQTRKAGKNADPIFNNEVFQALVPVVRGWSFASKLTAEVWDDNDGREDIIGTTSLKVNNILSLHCDTVNAGHESDRTDDASAVTGTVFPLDGAAYSSLKFCMLQPRRVSVRVVSASQLHDTGQHGGAGNDVYAIVFWNGSEVGRTRVVRKTLHPCFDALSSTFELMLPNTVTTTRDGNARLRVELWDTAEDADDFLGQAIVRANLLLTPPAHSREFKLDLTKAVKRKYQKNVGGKVTLNWFDVSYPTVDELQLVEEARRGDQEQRAEAARDARAKAAAQAKLLGQKKQHLEEVKVAKAAGLGLTCEECEGRRSAVATLRVDWGGTTGSETLCRPCYELIKLGRATPHMRLEMDPSKQQMRSEITFDLKERRRYAAPLVQVARNHALAEHTSRPLRKGDGSTFVRVFDDYVLPDGRGDPHNHLYSNKIVPSRAIEAPKSQSTQSQGPPTKIAFHEGEYVFFREPEVAPDAARPQEQLHGMVISGPILRKADQNETLYCVRWFRGVRILPTGLFQCYADFDPPTTCADGRLAETTRTEIDKFRYELHAAEAYANAYRTDKNKKAAAQEAAIRVNLTARQCKARDKADARKLRGKVMDPLLLANSSLEFIIDEEGHKTQVKLVEMSPRSKYEQQKNNFAQSAKGKMPDAKKVTYKELVAQQMRDEIGLPPDPNARKVGDVGHEDVLFEIDEGGTWRSFTVSREHVKLVLVKGCNLTRVQDSKKAKMQAVFHRSRKTDMTIAFGYWLRFVRWSEKQEKSHLRELAAQHIQSLARGVLARMKVDEVRVELLRLQRKRARAEARRQRRIARFLARSAKQADNKDAVTIDGKAFFKRLRELETWQKARAAGATKCLRWLLVICTDKLEWAMTNWKEGARIRHDEEIAMQHMPAPPSVLWAKMDHSEAENHWSGIWHPAIDISAPPMPKPGAFFTTEGKFSIESYGMYANFKKVMSGPTDVSNWIVRERILVGAYPIGQASAKAERVTSRSPAITQILLQGLGVWVCLMEPWELEEFEKNDGVKPWKVDVTDKWKLLRKEFRDSLKARTRNLRLAEKGVEMSIKYDAEGKRRVLERYRDALKDWVEAKNRLWQLPKSLKFLSFPIQVDATADKGELRKFLEEVESMMRPQPAATAMSEDTLASLFTGKPEIVEERLVLLEVSQWEWVLNWTQTSVEKFEEMLHANDFLQWDELNEVDVKRNDFFVFDPLGRPLYNVMERAAFLRRERAVGRLPTYDLANMYMFSREGHGRTGILGGCMMGRLYGFPPQVVLERLQLCHDVRTSMAERPQDALPISTPKMVSQTRQVHEILSETEAIYGSNDRRDSTDFLQQRDAVRGLGCKTEPEPPKYTSSSLKVQAMMDGVPLDVLQQHYGHGREKIWHPHYAKIKEKSHYDRVIAPRLALLEGKEKAKAEKDEAKQAKARAAKKAKREAKKQKEADSAYVSVGAGKIRLG